MVTTAEPAHTVINTAANTSAPSLDAFQDNTTLNERHMNSGPYIYMKGDVQ